MTVALATLAMLTLMACGGNGGPAKQSDTPKEVVKKAMTCAVNEDFEGMVQYFKGTADATDEEIKQAGAVLTLLYSLGDGVKDFAILSEEIDDSGLEAEVTLSITDKKGNVRQDDVDLVKTDAGWRMKLD